MLLYHDLRLTVFFFLIFYDNESTDEKNAPIYGAFFRSAIIELAHHLAVWLDD
ncbi:Uncharacterised protein [Moraxella ovis]|nr:Uncharacterised protein [Moraxella ovis]